MVLPEVFEKKTLLRHSNRINWKRRLGFIARNQTRDGTWGVKNPSISDSGFHILGWNAGTRQNCTKIRKRDPKNSYCANRIWWFHLRSLKCRSEMANLGRCDVTLHTNGFDCGGRRIFYIYIDVLPHPTFLSLATIWLLLVNPIDTILHHFPRTAFVKSAAWTPSTQRIHMPLEFSPHPVSSWSQPRMITIRPRNVFDPSDSIPSIPRITT